MSVPGNFASRCFRAAATSVPQPCHCPSAGGPWAPRPGHRRARADSRSSRSATQCRLPGGHSGGRGDAHPAAAGSRPLRGGVCSPWLAVGVDAAVVRGQCLCRAPFPGGTRLGRSRQRGAPPSAGGCGGRRLLPPTHARGGGAITVVPRMAIGLNGDRADTTLELPAG